MSKIEAVVDVGENDITKCISEIPLVEVDAYNGRNSRVWLHRSPVVLLLQRHPPRVLLRMM
jgi:hypothetical protein